ncbi:PLP-dependent aminotransferase family protein [Dyella sp. C9]|uniref:MocR-like pyridoxine biosynthesis transcription factor PdxR n=1 Tax=Dyella sp. C9 TaxID=2202154 RepID=UPI000DEFB299|nr:PLP-dependent aminotransferase family protein [Dyella sp. C9]
MARNAPRPFWIALERSQGGLESQLYAGLRDQILAGTIAGGHKLPSTRELAVTLGISRATVVSAFDRLKAEGYLETRKGSATRVSMLPPAINGAVKVQAQRQVPATRTLSDPRLLKPGAPDLEAFPRAEWASALASRARSLRDGDLDYRDETGLPELKEAIIEHVTATRGVNAEPDQVVIVPTARAAIDLVAGEIFKSIPVDQQEAWIEEPGYWAAQGILKSIVSKLVPVPCDADGLDPLAAPAGHPKLIYTTPSHQYPTGVSMSLERRLSLLALAERTGAIIIEDDYDSEFHQGPQAMPSLQGIDRSGSVVYLGTFSKLLAPAIRVGYMIVPRAILELVSSGHRRKGLAVSLYVQAALSTMMKDGRTRAHLRRVRPLYAERMAATVRALTAHCGGYLRVGDGRDGLQLTTWFIDPQADDVSIARALQDEGYGVRPLSPFFLGSARPGLLFGISSVDVGSIDRQAQVVAQAIGQRVAGKPR